MTNILMKVATLQVYIHWLKGVEVEFDLNNIDIGKLEYLYQIAKKNLSEYGLFPSFGYSNWTFNW